MLLHILKTRLPEGVNKLIKPKEQVEMNQYNIQPNSVRHALKNSLIATLSSELKC